MRDRDETGRARNARPRDAYGRPLPRGTAGEDRVPDDYAAEPAEALAEAQRLLDADRPFHAHEVLEAAWKAAPESERELWQGLAQLAVGFTHVRRGNARGARTLLCRAADRLALYAASSAPRGTADVPGRQETADVSGRHGTRDASGPYGIADASGPHGIAVAELVRAARELADRIERDGLAAVTDADLTPRLRERPA